MQNILFVLYNDFHSQSAIHVHHFANNLIIQGLDCVVCVPRDKHTVTLLQNTSYKVTEFSEISNLKDFFRNGKEPDIVHAWTPRAVLISHEPGRRQGYDDSVDQMLLLDQWELDIKPGDSYYNLNFDPERNDYTIRS